MAQPFEHAASRHVAFEACFNFRDLGGYETADGGRLRWRVLYRSDTLHRLTPGDLEAFGALGLRTVVDLRSRTELDDYGRLREGAHSAAWHHRPMLDDVRLRPPTPGEATRPTEQLAEGEGYFRILQAFAPSVAQTFHLLATDGALPAVFHCTSGKDRTGIIAALTLDLCGVADDTIAADYVLTEQSRQRSLEWIEANEPEFAALLASLPPERRRIRPEAILGMLERVRLTWGSTAELLGSLGITESERAGLVDALVER